MAITGDIDLGQWLSTMYSDYTAGRAQKEDMFGKGVGALESYAGIFQPGGEYGQGVEAAIGRGEKKAVAGGMQSLVSSGLANTTMPMHLQQTYQEEVGMPTRMMAEDRRMEHLGGALGSLGQMYAGYDPGSATAGDIAHMATGGFSTQMSSRIADMNAQIAARSTPSGESYSQNLFKDKPSSGGTSGTSGTSTSQHGGGVTNPFGVSTPREPSKEEYTAWKDLMRRAAAFGRPIPPKPWEQEDSVWNQPTPGADEMLGPDIMQYDTSNLMSESPVNAPGLDIYSQMMSWGM